MDPRRWLSKAAMVVAALLLAAGAQAHTLRLKSGQVVYGTYLGGTKDQVQFLVNGEVKVYSTADILSIQFTSRSSAASTPAEPARLTRTVTVPQGTRLLVRMIDSVDSDTNKVGDIFHASLEDDLRIGDVVVARKGADVYGKLVAVQSAGRLTGKSELALELTGIRLVDGTVHSITTGAYQEAGASRTGQTVKRAVGGAAIGAVIGAIAGGGSGAAKGAGIGAAAGTGITLITRGEQVKVPSETLLEFQLAQPLMVTLPK
jgi:hypothetical protein